MSQSALFAWRDAINTSSLPATVRHVALVISTCMNGRGVAREGLEDLARMVGCHQTTVSRALRSLIDAGALVRAAGGGRGVTSTYRAVLSWGGETHAGSTQKPMQTGRETHAPALDPFDSFVDKQAASVSGPPRLPLHIAEPLPRPTTEGDDRVERVAQIRDLRRTLVAARERPRDER